MKHNKSREGWRDTRSVYLCFLTAVISHTHIIHMYTYIHIYTCFCVCFATFSQNRYAGCRIVECLRRFCFNLCALCLLCLVCQSRILCVDMGIEMFAPFHCFISHTLIYYRRRIYTNGLWKQFPYIFNVQYTQIFKYLTNLVVRFDFGLSFVCLSLCSSECLILILCNKSSEDFSLTYLLLILLI